MIARLRDTLTVLDAVLDARGRRLWAVTAANARGQGGQTRVAKATGWSRRTINQGVREIKPLSSGHQTATPRGRRPGGGRKALTEHDQTLWADLEALGEPTSRGDPASPWRWTCTRVRQLAAARPRQGQKVGRHTVAARLAALADSLHGHRQTPAGAGPPDRQAHCDHINAHGAACQTRGQPVVSVATQTNALVGDCTHGGRAWRPPGAPALVRPDDCADKTLGQGNPDGVADQPAKGGGVSGGGEHDTAALAVASSQRGWTTMGACRDQEATDWLLTADGGGRHGRRSRLGTVAWPRLADATGWRLAGCHVPPGTSPWHQSEHRLGSHIRMHGRGQPLTSHAVSVQVSATTTTETGVKIQADLDTGCDPTGSQVPAPARQDVAREPAACHGEWHDPSTPRTTHN